MRRTFTLALAASVVLALPGCGTTGLGGLLGGAPPTASALNATSIDEAGIDLIRDLFDVGLFGVDALVELNRPCCRPGTPEARSLARTIRQIAGFLGAADSAQKAGSSATYAEALGNARTALRQFQRAIGMPETASLRGAIPPNLSPQRANDAVVMIRDGRNLSFATYERIADRLDGNATGGGHVAIR